MLLPAHQQGMEEWQLMLPASCQLSRQSQQDVEQKFRESGVIGGVCLPQSSFCTGRNTLANAQPKDTIGLTWQCPIQDAGVPASLANAVHDHVVDSQICTRSASISTGGSPNCQPANLEGLCTGAGSIALLLPALRRWPRGH